MSFWDGLAQFGGGALQGAGALTSLLPGGQLIGAGMAGLGSAWKGADDYFVGQNDRRDALAMNQANWARDDNAVQRRAADMKSAGFNPLLAAGSPAGNTAGVTGPPSRTSNSDVAGVVMDTMRGSQSIAKTQAETNLINAKRDLVPTQKRDITAAAEGKEISNEFNRSVNPLRAESLGVALQSAKVQKDSQELQLGFDRAANPVRLASLASSLEGLNLSNVNKRLDSQLSALDISKAQLDIVRKKYENESAFQGLDVQRKDAMIKALALDAMTMNNGILDAKVRAGAGNAAALGQWASVLGAILGAGRAADYNMMNR